MHRIRTTTAAILSTAALTLAGAPVAAHATAPDQGEKECARATTKLEQAQEAMDRVTAVFAKKVERVAEARTDVKEADNRSERAKAVLALKEAKEKKEHAAKAKKAQQNRLAKRTEEHLAACGAGGTTAS
jgi:DNA-binding helix-hairpin-helix protein with protein kinase domain